jgi:AsmA protein
MRISGPFTSLSYKLDVNAMISGAAQRKIDEKQEELKAKVQDKLKDQLKGLFGR